METRTKDRYSTDIGDSMCYFKKHNYKVSTIVGRDLSLMIPMTTVLDTGVDSNIINIRFPPPAWKSDIRTVAAPPLLDASNKLLRYIGTLDVHVRISEFKSRIRFMVVKSLSVDSILGTTFIDQHVRADLPSDRKFFNPVTMVGRPLPKTEHRLKRSMSTQALSFEPRSWKIHLSSHVTINPLRHVYARVQCPTGGLFFVQSHPKPLLKPMALTANGIIDTRHTNAPAFYCLNE